MMRFSSSSTILCMGVLVASVFATMGGNCVATAPPGDLTQLGYQNVCDSDDTTLPIEATVTRNPDDSYQLDAMVYRLVDSVNSAGDCRDMDGEFIDGQCYEIVTQSRQLSAAEIAQVDAVYSSLEVVSRLNPDWPGVDCELKSFCSAITHVNEDRYLNATNECRPLSEPALTTRSFDSVLELLSTLSSAE